MASDESFLLCIKGCFYLHSYRRLCACASVPLCGSHLRVTPEALYAEPLATRQRGSTGRIWIS